jgi:two-component system invasion response regulator UvrY
VSRVLIADDHAVVRAGFKQFLEADPTINAVGEAASGNETLDALRESEWDLVLLDIHMPDRSGLDILRHIQTGHPSVRVLVMSGLPEQQYAVNVLRAGASGYLSKDSAPEELMKAVRTVSVPRSPKFWWPILTAIPTNRCTRGFPRVNSKSFASWPQAAASRTSPMNSA